MCVACMDGKLADRKGYEFFRKLTGSADAASAPASSSASASSSSAASTAADSKTNVSGCTSLIN
jgi:hypothetical protein